MSADENTIQSPIEKRAELKNMMLKKMRPYPLKHEWAFWHERYVSLLPYTPHHPLRSSPSFPLHPQPERLSSSRAHSAPIPRAEPLAVFYPAHCIPRN